MTVTWKRRKFTVMLEDIVVADAFLKTLTAKTVDRALYCPVAICLRREGQPIAGVLPMYVNWRGHRDNHGYSMLPRSARRAIVHYDRTGKMKPFSFFIEVPE